MALTIVGVDAYDIRFPTSRTLAGSDAMNNDPDYSAAYVVLRTDHPTGLEGHGLTFTIGRGNEVCVPQPTSGRGSARSLLARSRSQSPSLNHAVPTDVSDLLGEGEGDGSASSSSAARCRSR